MLEESPSPANEVEKSVSAELKRALRKAIRALEKYRELRPSRRGYARDALYA
jgi:hypothetical protein